MGRFVVNGYLNNDESISHAFPFLLKNFNEQFTGITRLWVFFKTLFRGLRHLFSKSSQHIQDHPAVHKDIHISENSKRSTFFFSASPLRKGTRHKISATDNVENVFPYLFEPSLMPSRELHTRNTVLDSTRPFLSTKGAWWSRAPPCLTVNFFHSSLYHRIILLCEKFSKKYSYS